MPIEIIRLEIRFKKRVSFYVLLLSKYVFISVYIVTYIKKGDSKI